LQEHPNGGYGGSAEDRCQDPLAGEQEHQSQEHENAGDQACSPEDALARLRSTADAHRLISPSELTRDI
jgi:hypothetical protein